MKDDLISRRAAIDELIKMLGYCFQADEELVDAVVTTVKELPSVQPEERTDKRTETHTCDLISRQASFENHGEIKSYAKDTIDRQAAIDIVRHECGEWRGLAKEIVKQFNELPSAQPEPISEEYAKAVRTWLIDYQVRCAELKGRYTPYEILGWIVSDWRKENEIW